MYRSNPDTSLLKRRLRDLLKAAREARENKDERLFRDIIDLVDLGVSWRDIATYFDRLMLTPDECKKLYAKAIMWRNDHGITW